MTNPSSKAVEPALKECPWCGITANLETGELKMFRVACRAATCRIWPSTPWYRDREEAVAIWNTHVSADSAGAIVNASCWHCGVVLACSPKLRCENCPDECDVEDCNELGCQPAAASPAVPGDEAVE